jgi:hypothetical protein
VAANDDADLATDTDLFDLAQITAQNAGGMVSTRMRTEGGLFGL